MCIRDRAQWEYQQSKTWIDQNLNTYEKNLDEAKKLLEEDGWTLNADGTEYSGTGPVSYTHLDVYKRHGCMTPPRARFF